MSKKAIDKATFVDQVNSQKISDLQINEETIVCGPTTTLHKVTELFVEMKMGSVIVMDTKDPVKRPLGIFTERDLVRCVAKGTLDLFTETVSNHMTPNPKSVLPEVTLIEAMKTMRAGNFRHLVITNTQGAISGVISIRDIMLHLLDELNRAK